MIDDDAWDVVIDAWVHVSKWQLLVAFRNQKFMKDSPPGGTDEINRMKQRRSGTPAGMDVQ